MAQKILNLALQGGGAHGAYTWGVLDRLLDEKDIDIHGVSGSSAGAMNAVVMSYGFRKGNRKGAKQALSDFWTEVSSVGALCSPVKATPLEQWQDKWNLDGSFSYEVFDMLTRIFSPYQINPFNLNPLRYILRNQIDWDVVNGGGDMPLFLTATSVRTGRPRIFRCHEVTIESLLASACIPFYFQTIEIDGEPYWDGGYMGNPSIWPLIYYTHHRDILLVQINPLEREGTPHKASEIINRLNEITFNSSLISEMRAIDFVTRLIDENHLSGEKYKHVNMHMIPSPTMTDELNSSSKLNTDIKFFTLLREVGQNAAEAWLKKNKDQIGVQGSIDIKETFLGTAQGQNTELKHVMQKKAS
jgi:NTE family protein